MRRSPVDNLYRLLADAKALRDRLDEDPLARAYPMAEVLSLSESIARVEADLAALKAVLRDEP